MVFVLDHIASIVFVFLAATTSTMAAEPLAVGRFFNPPNPPVKPVRGGGYSVNPVWTIGNTESIQWTTTFSNYTIVLWQQTLLKAESSKGPAIFQTERGAVTTFDWVVQPFEFDLKKSNVFFLWLHPGPYSENGDVTGPSITSRYFNITSELPESSASTSISQSTSTSISEPSPSRTETQGDLQTSSPSSSPSIPSTSVSAISAAANSTNSSGGLKTSIQVGIGVGATAGFFVIAFAAWLAMLHFRRKKKVDSQKHESSNGHSMGFNIRSVYHKTHLPFERRLPAEVDSGFDKDSYTSELAWGHKKAPVELG